MNDKEFNELEQRYLYEKQNRQKLQKIKSNKNRLINYLEKINKAKGNPWEVVGGMKLSCYISYGDCEGRREIDRDNIEIDLGYDQFINILKEEINKADKQLKEFQSKHDIATAILWQRKVKKKKYWTF